MHSWLYGALTSLQIVAIVVISLSDHDPILSYDFCYEPIPKKDSYHPDALTFLAKTRTLLSPNHNSEDYLLDHRAPNTLDYKLLLLYTYMRAEKTPHTVRFDRQRVRLW